MSGLLREVLKKRSFYGQADRKGGWSEVKPAKNDDVIYEQPLMPIYIKVAILPHGLLSKMLDG